MRACVWCWHPAPAQGTHQCIMCFTTRVARRDDGPSGRMHMNMIFNILPTTDAMRCGALSACPLSVRMSCTRAHAASTTHIVSLNEHTRARKYAALVARQRSCSAELHIYLCVRVLVRTHLAIVSVCAHLRARRDYTAPHKCACGVHLSVVVPSYVCGA